MEDKPERRERKDAQRNLQRVLEAAHELVAEQGVEVTIEMVARRAGVGIGTVYRRFPSKEQLIAAVSHAACHEAHRCLAEAARGAADATGKLRALVAVHFRRSASLVALLDPHAAPYARGRAPSVAEQQHFFATLHHMLQHVIADGQREGAMREGDPAVLAALCLQLLHPRAVHDLLHMLGGDVDAAADHTTRFILTALRRERDGETGRRG